MIVDAILVPQGAGYRAVCRGLRRVAVPTPPVFPIPAGVMPVRRHLEQWQQTGSLPRQSRVLLMGLCGS